METLKGNLGRIYLSCVGCGLKGVCLLHRIEPNGACVERRLCCIGV